jgi:two-component system chemotaxis response regulator CheB
VQQVLGGLPARFPLPLLVAVHMPASFTPAYAERLDRLCSIRVREAVDGDVAEPGLALLAPGGRQLLVEPRHQRFAVRVVEGAAEIYKPSVDVLLGSAARAVPGGVLGIVLTGMGADGRQGAKLLKSSGSQVWSQDAASCVVYGMPQAVEKAGLSDQVLSITDIGAELGRLA